MRFRGRSSALKTLRIVTLIFAFQLVSAMSPSAHAQQEKPAQNLPPTPSAATATPPPGGIPEQMRKTVAFLTVVYQDDPANVATRGGVIGTGFLVFLADKRLGDNQGFMYLVTNRHVAEPGIELGAPHHVIATFVRMNLASPQGNVGSAQMPLPAGQVFHWHFPKDAAVDLAVMPLVPPSSISFVPVPSSIIVSQNQVEDGDVVVGDHLVFAGYFSSFPGAERIEPIVREGVIAMMPTEDLNTTLTKPGRLYLADLHAFHGNSGSPVFVNLSATPHHGTYDMGGEKYRLLGLISGYYPESAGFSVPAAQVLTGEVRDNSGIATVVPGQEIQNLLNSPELQTERDKEVAEVLAKRAQPHK